ncbi:hypothetical protein [Listeria booriae]|nr:hypothetical protein [Listeria booriae]
MNNEYWLGKKLTVQEQKRKSIKDQDKIRKILVIRKRKQATSQQ